VLHEPALNVRRQIIPFADWAAPRHSRTRRSTSSKSLDSYGNATIQLAVRLPRPSGQERWPRYGTTSVEFTFARFNLARSLNRLGVFVI
jgi:hypothetical protein